MLEIKKLFHPDADPVVEEQEMKLDDARRVKVLSPSMMVFKRFVRNRLAIVGTCILVLMFLFSFVGAWISPYGESQVFYKDVEEWKSYATGAYNVQPRFVYASASKDTSVESAVLFALGQNRDANDRYALTEGQQIPVTAGTQQYSITVIDPDPEAPSLAIYATKDIASYSMKTLTVLDDTVSADIVAGIQEFCDKGAMGSEFTVGDTLISVSGDKLSKTFSIVSDVPVAVSTYRIYSAMLGRISMLQSDAEFLSAVSDAIRAHSTAVSYGGAEYALLQDGEGTLVTAADGVKLFRATEQYLSMTYTDEITDEETGVTELKEVDFAASLGEDLESFRSALKIAVEAGETEFVFGEQTYTVEYAGDPIVRRDGVEVMEISINYDPVESEEDALCTDFGFVLASEIAIAGGEQSMQYNGKKYELATEGDDTMFYNEAGDRMIMASNVAMGPALNGIELTVDFRLKLQEAMRSHSDRFTFVNQYGEEVEARIGIVNANYYVETMQNKTLYLIKDGVSREHLLGTDVNGMDVLTRLMYGGRISLLVGFVVIFFEIIIGVIIGGISGYFGGWIDTLLMRFVELFNALPAYPLYIIFGSLMDEMRVEPWSRIFILMAIIGILGWTGVARVVRGQILSLREQEFMIATEATGIRVSKRIFRHLVPNVMPLLIVNATMGLGSIILLESTLGYLGLGVKFPMASWGSIINQVTDMQIMTTAWWIWIPAGVLIVLTVLGFNFVGDGLRDAFDPKMKR